MTENTEDLTPGQRRTANAVLARKRKAAERRHARWITELEEYGYTVSEPGATRLEMAR